VALSKENECNPRSTIMDFSSSKLPGRIYGDRYTSA
jgi:hypothetical protein